MSHAVQFYNDDVFLIDAVAGFIRAGSQEGATIIVVATGKHREDLRKVFQESGDSSIESKVLYFNASELLSAFMVDGWPNQTRFTAKVGRIVQQAALRGPVRIFGEMVAVMWAEGKIKAAIRLEELWNEIATMHEFALLCAYPTSSFPDQNHESFHQVCHTHTHVHTPG